uniref:DUF4230 domain-containing protein n=1 Tax=Macrostomum lignano TaxID=282301 RepID=A0A1I8FJA3_9PLAT
VETPIPLFTLYKRWQRSRGYDAQLQTGTGSASATTTAAAAASKLKIPARQQQQAEAAPPQQQPRWQPAAQRLAPKRLPVRPNLSAKTPNNLLSKELWLASLNAADWWRTLLNYSRSVAVMSIIGYVIGWATGTWRQCAHRRSAHDALRQGDAAHPTRGIRLRPSSRLGHPASMGGYTGAHLGGRRGGGGGIDGIASRRQLEDPVRLEADVRPTAGEFRPVGAALLDRSGRLSREFVARIRKVRVAEDQLAAAKEALSDACAVRAYITDGRSATAAPGV